MINYKRKLLLGAAFVGISFANVFGVDWVPVGRLVDTGATNSYQEYAYESVGSYQNTDIISDPSQGYLYNMLPAGADRTINVYGSLYWNTNVTNGHPSGGGVKQLDGGGLPIPCSLKVDGIVVLDATSDDLDINVLEPVIIEPYLDLTGSSSATGASNVSHLYFWTGKDVDGVPYEINVNIEPDADIVFQGITDNDDGDLVKQDLYLTFAGNGKVAFNIPNCSSVWFNGQVDQFADTVSPDDNGLLLPDGGAAFTNDAGGCKVFVTMEQTQEEVSFGENKVVFNLIQTEGLEDLNSVVGVGPNSVFTYLSPDDTGEDVDPETSFGGYAAVAFDPTNPGFLGRLVLWIRGAYELDEDSNIINRRPFNDGAFIVAGHFVNDFEAETISGDGGQIPPSYFYNTPAGIQAICRVVDDQAYNVAEFPYAPSLDDRRGLLIVNDCHNHGKLAADPYWDTQEDFNNTDDVTDNGNFPFTPSGLMFSPWYAWGNDLNPFVNSATVLDSTTPFLTRRGCIIGVNGQLDIYANCFCHHVACATNVNDPLEYLDQAAFNGDGTLVGSDFAYAASLLKLRNPSALIIDGLDVALFTNGNPLSEFELAFVAANPFQRPVDGAPLRKAEIVFRGDGSLYLSESGSTAAGYSFGVQAAEDENFNDILDNGSAERNYLLTHANVPFLCISNLVQNLAIDDAATFDGYKLSVNDDAVQAGEGEHVLDVEGQLDIIGLNANSTGDPITFGARDYDTDYNDAVFGIGIVNAASLALDHTGFEVFPDETPLFRPLSLVDSYLRYNSPTLFFNNHAALFNCILDHSDVTKFVNPVPDLSEPGITGGERLFFLENVWGANQDNIDLDPDRDRTPEIQLFNSEVDFQESLNASGVRIVVKDIPGQPDINGDNFSVFAFFDHGDQLDTLLTRYGRIFLLSSALNLMADGSTNYATESTFLNVFKTNGPVGEFLDNAIVNLSLINVDQFPDSVNPSLYNLQRGHHLIMVSVPTADGAACYARIGWERMSGEQAFFPGSFPDVLEPISPDFTEITTFDLDAFNVPPATVSIDGSIIGFGSFDINGNGPVIPVPNAYTNGTVYVDCGGRLTITRPDANAPFDVNSIPNQAVIATTIAQRIRNDYNFAGNERLTWRSGDVDLPHDQAKYDPFYSVQPYGIDADVISENPDTQGYLRISFENPDREFGGDRLRRDRSGAKEVTMAPFHNELLGHTIYLKSLAQQLRTWTRATESVNVPFPVPVGSDWDEVAFMPYIGVNDDITQLRVAGATMADPFYLDVSGDGASPFGARIREITSVTTQNIPTDHIVSEGAHGVLFGEYNGRFGLGSRRYNEHSVKAWNLLGKDNVTICPMGNMTVDLNDNLLVVDRLALIASTKFGRPTDEEDTKSQRLTFHSTKPLEIRIPSYGELDLSSFGQSANRQEIAFSGNVCVVFEEGATLRLPQPNEEQGGVVLYFNDNSQLIFEGSTTDFSDPFVRYDDAIESNIDRTRILGKGQIWLNKNAKLSVNGTAKVGVQTDELTPETDVTISIRGQGRMEIGNELVSGGAFEVGDQQGLRSRRATRAGESINFSLILNGIDATFHIDREGFLGLGAGVVNKQGAPNGFASVVNNPVLDVDGVAEFDINNFPLFNPDFDNAWTVQSLQNVNNVTIQVDQGIFDHNNAVDGSVPTNGTSPQGSLIALGQVNGSYRIRLDGAGEALVRGGGNMMLVPLFNEFDPLEQGLFYVNIWDFHGQVASGEEYGVMTSGNMIRDRRTSGREGDIAAGNYGTTGISFVGGADGAFELLDCKSFGRMNAKQVVFSSTNFADTFVWCNEWSANNPEAKYRLNNAAIGTQIYRQTDLTSNTAQAALEQAAEQGSMGATAQGAIPSSNPQAVIANG